MIETHCHLDYLKDRPLEETLKLSEEAGVSTFITIGVSPKNLDTVFEISTNNKQVYFTQGIHPHDAKLYTDEVEAIIKARTTESKMVAVGEIGLDYHYDNSPRDIQCTVFERQLQIAIDTNKPVVIHTRDADEDTAEILKKLAPKLSRKGVVHSFTSSVELAQTVLDLGFYIGINGIITFKNAENVRDIVRLTPLDRMLIETDSPFLAPIPNRGRENAPFNLPHIVKKIAEIKEVSEEEVIEVTTRNAKALFLL
tara:strand:+ start:2323 stop:3084 length:762 start_codon:yes stop_codon:yes gene_type:complete